MYANCIFCSSNLGSNEMVEHFPVGRRLAFDPARGRLWVVCRSCGRWNLTPLEERWEAIEECGKLYSGTLTRASTENIGLAKTREGLELVRIGSPLRPEFAAWRYGDQFRRRHGRVLVFGGVATAAAVGYAAAMPLLIGAGLLTALTSGGACVFQAVRRGDIAAHVPTGHRSLHRIISVRRDQLRNTLLYRSPDGRELMLHVPSEQGEWTLRGEHAVRALRHLLPGINDAGASARRVEGAVERLERARDPSRYMLIAGHPISNPDRRLAGLPAEARLALEMAVNEEQERAAFEGELAQLENMWRNAEEIASIADNLLVPEWIEKFIARHRALRTDLSGDATVT